MVQEGSFSLSTGGADAGEPLVVGRGALIGELALITETTRPVTATALEPSTVLRIPRGLFLKMLDGYPSAAEKLRDILATRMRSVHGRHLLRARHPGRRRAAVLTPRR